MPNYRAMARRAAARYGLDPRIFERQIQQESGFAEDVITGRRASGAGALGIAQIMPKTAAGWGVDPLNPKAALNAAAKNMAAYVKRYGGYENALRAYNAGPGKIEASKGFAETNNYVRTILGGRDPGRLSAPSASGGGGGSVTTTTLSPGKSVNVAQLLSTLRAQTEAESQPPAQAPVAPSFSAAPVTPEGYQAPVSSPPRAKTDFAAALTALSEASAASEPGGVTTTTTGGGGGTGGGGTNAPGDVPQVKGQLYELIWRGPGSQTVKNGQRVDRDTFTKHEDHVHVAARQKDLLKLGRLAESMGLHVGENPAFGTVTPVHVGGSFHYGRSERPGEHDRAIDVGGDTATMKKFAKLVSRAYSI